jgi:hypothetical protein
MFALLGLQSALFVHIMAGEERRRQLTSIDLAQTIAIASRDFPY